MSEQMRKLRHFGLLTAIACLTYAASAYADPSMSSPPETLPPLQNRIDAAANAPERDPVEHAVAGLEGTAIFVPVMLETCDLSFPSYRANNDRAYEVWKAKQKAWLDEIDRYASAVILRNSGGNAALATQVKRQYRARTRAAIQKQSREDPAQFGLMCEQYPQLLNQAHFDLNANHPIDLSVLRDHPVARR
jgi:hypothetical protein